MIFKHTHSQRSDIFRFEKSVTLIAPADETYTLIQIPQFAFVTDLWLVKLLAGTVIGCTLSVGFTGNGETADPDGFIDTTLGNGDAAGVVRALGDTQPGSQGKWFNDAGGAITVTTVDDVGVAATLYVAALFAVIH